MGIDKRKTCVLHPSSQASTAENDLLAVAVDDLSAINFQIRHYMSAGSVEWECCGLTGELWREGLLNHVMSAQAGRPIWGLHENRRFTAVGQAFGPSRSEP